MRKEKLKYSIDPKEISQKKWAKSLDPFVHHISLLKIG